MQLIIMLMLEFYNAEMRAAIADRAECSPMIMSHMFNCRIARDAGDPPPINHIGFKVASLDATIAECIHMISTLKKLKIGPQNN